MSPGIESRLRDRLRSTSLPPAPPNLREFLTSLPESDRSRRNRAPLRALLLVAAITLGGAAAIFQVGTHQQAVLPESPSPSPSATAEGPSASIPAVVDGLPLRTVSEVLNVRRAGGLKNQPVAVGGYWSYQPIAFSCAAPQGQPGELEMWCQDGKFGITERNELMLEVLSQPGFSSVRGRDGPYLTPWVPDRADQERLFTLPVINGQFYPPVPIVVVGHFDDPAADKCRPKARQICLDRFVIDRIVLFDPASVPAPTPTPVPSPFPYADPPPARFQAKDCAGNVDYSFVGWTTLADLGLDIGGANNDQGHIYAMVTRKVMPIGEWILDPAGSGHKFRWWGRRICYVYELEEPGSMGFAAVPASGFKEWDDGHRTPGNPP